MIKKDGLKCIHKYLRSLKPNNKNEIYEIMILMMLYDGFINTLAELISDGINSPKKNRDGSFNFKIVFRDDYERTVSSICKSKYFAKNFTPFEIKKKSEIMNNIMIEIVMGEVGSDIFNIKDVNVDSANTTHALIEHKISKFENFNKIEMSFYEEETLDNIVNYLKNVIKLKNNPKKKKLSLGKSYRLLSLRNEIKTNIEKYRKYKGEELDDILLNEWGKKYKDKFPSKDAMVQSLRRINIVKKQINIPGGTN